MSGSDLLVFLPAAGGIGAILGAIIGAYVGARRTGKIRAQQDKEALDRERRGLMALITLEILANDAPLKLEASPAEVTQRLDSSVWDSCQTRLAQLLPIEELNQITLYYALLKLIRGRWSSESGKLSESHRELINDIRVLGDSVRHTAQHYVQDPQFFRSLEEQQSQVEDAQEDAPSPGPTG